ncbi:MAG TPA: hypothetical protein H9693_06395 [Firmicutes bacterium]|nr:hypothetical protein [Bacillota bacterium]
MSKNLLFKVLVALCFVAAAVLWILSAADIIAINMSWAIAVFAFVLGALFIGKGLFSRNVGTFKKLNILFGAVFVVAGVLALVGTFIEESLVLPIIALIVTLAVLLCILATGGRKWDQGDNDNAGYKNYWQRKKEKEEQEKNRDDKDE